MTTYTLKFTAKEFARIEKAATALGLDGESAIWAREILLANVDSVLRSEKPRQGDRLRARLQYLTPIR